MSKNTFRFYGYNNDLSLTIKHMGGDSYVEIELDKEDLEYIYRQLQYEFPEEQEEQ